MRVAYLHGFLGDAAVWPAALDGERIALPGHLGGPRVGESWDANFALVRAAIGEVDLVVGYSLGARVALGLFASGAVKRAVLISGNPGISDTERAARRANDAMWAARFRASLPDALDAWEAQPLFASQARASESVRAERRARRLALDPAQLARSLETMGLAEMPDYRGAIDPARVALVVGADDAKFRAIAAATGAPVHAIADAGHDPLLEQPAATAALIRSIA